MKWMILLMLTIVLVEVKRAAEHIITHFRVPLESKGVILATTLEEIVDYGRKYLDIN